MEISERYQCYVLGQCQVGFNLNICNKYNPLILEMALSLQEYSVNFQGQSTDAESCHKMCGKNKDCEWWSWEPAQSLCMLFSNCTESGHPEAEIPDGRCGPNFQLKDGTPGQCDPNANANMKGPCCSSLGYCGNSNAHCKCKGCTDFRQSKQGNVFK